MNKFYIIMIGLFSTFTINSQNVSDAVRFSFYQPNGTAGSAGLGNALGAMGADFSIIGINPAGIAEYRKGALTFTTSINNTSTDAFFVDDGTTSSRSRSALTLDNASFVSANTGRKWNTSNWVVGFNKLTSFGRDIKIEGTTEGNIAERFLERAQGLDLDELDAFEAGVAFDSEIIFLDEDGNYTSDYFDDDIVSKDQFIEQRGSINELTIGWAGNYDEKFNLGISAGIPFVTFTENKTYKERFAVANFSNELDYIESLSTTGTGINFKIGAQYRASRKIRIGAAIHSPTWYSLSDDFSTSASYQFNGETQSGGGSALSPDGSFRYRLNTPWKAVGSIGSIYTIGNIKGFINADIEFIDYTNNEFDFTSFSDDPVEVQFTQEVNENINTELGSATNFRIGTELALNDIRFRLGYNIITSPFINETDINTIFSGGLGFRGEGFFVDISYSRDSFEEGYSPYVLSTVSGRDPLANISTDIGNFSATVGFTF